MKSDTYEDWAARNRMQVERIAELEAQVFTSQNAFFEGYYAGYADGGRDECNSSAGPTPGVAWEEAGDWSGGQPAETEAQRYGDVADLEKRCAKAGADADEHMAARIDAEHRVEELERRVERLRDLLRACRDRVKSEANAEGGMVARIDAALGEEENR